jgi:hypothetical protein
VSIRLIQALLSHERAPADSGQRLVQLLLAYYANDDGTEARPGMRLLCRDAVMPESTLYRHLAGLVEDGWIVRDRASSGSGRAGGRGRPTVWRVFTEPKDLPSVRGHSGEMTSHTEGNDLSKTGERPLTPRFTTRQDPSIDPSVVSHARELVTPELLPAPAPDGAGNRNPGGELVMGERLDRLIAAVNEHRQPPLTRAQAVAARKLARDCLQAGWDPRLIVAALVATAAFTMNAVTFAVDQLRRQHQPAPIAWDRMSAAERSEEVLRRAKRGEL